jgi:hypothetical protein
MITKLVQRSPLGAADTAATGSILGEWLLNVGQRKARERICHLLCELALRQEAMGVHVGPDYRWKITQEQLGDATGLTSVHVNRTLQSLRRDGLLRPDRRQVTVADWRRLGEQGDFTPAYLHLPREVGDEDERLCANWLEPRGARAA